MSRETVNALCRLLPSATWSDPFGPGHDIWKVGDKIFAAIGSEGTGVSVKTPSVEDAQLLIDMGHASRAPYFHRSWVHVPLDTPAAEVQDRIATSYRIIRASLSKKRQAMLDPV